MSVFVDRYTSETTVSIVIELKIGLKKNRIKEVYERCRKGSEMYGRN